MADHNLIKIDNEVVASETLDSSLVNTQGRGTSFNIVDILCKDVAS